MNVKTTVVLAFLLVMSVLGLYIVRSRPAESASAKPPARASSASRDLIENKLGDVTKIVVTRKDHDGQWVFEKSDADKGATAVWRMVTPREMKVTSWEVDRIPRQLTGLQYEISYAPGEPGAVSAEQAGLDTPLVTVALTDGDGKTATVEIGKPASADETYVRLAGSDRVCVGKSNLRSLLKSRAIEYRDNQPWTFQPNEVTRLEIEDHSSADAVEYAFVPVGADWRMESPASAKATGKAADAVRELSRLRVGSWIDDDASKLAVYGLDPAPITIRVTVQHTVEPPKDKATDDKSGEEDESADADKHADKAAPTVETNVYQLALSDRAPIGEEAKVYIGAGDPLVVGTIAKAIADKLRPAMAEWRDMTLATTDVAAATRIELNVDGEATNLVRGDGAWTIEPGDAHAEGSEVAALLAALGALKAVAFEPNGDVAATGLDEPRATISLTMPEAAVPVRVSIGGPTDATTRLLTFVRFGDDAPVAKVKTSDVAGLLKSSLAYRDRTIFNLAAASINGLGFTVKAPFAEQPLVFALGKSDDKWSMTEPASAPVRAEAVNKLVAALAGLRADAVVATEGQDSAYGLHDPSVRVSVSTESGEAYSLLATQHDAGYYAKRGDSDVIYAITGAFYAQLTAELRQEAVVSFDAGDVVSFSVAQGGVLNAFQRSEDGWTYEAEPDLPLDSKKVEDLLLRVRDLKTERFVRYDTPSDPAALGLVDADRTITIAFKDQPTLVLTVSSQSGSTGAPPGRLATIAGHSGVFILSNEMLARATVSLDDLSK